ncbi:MAG: hypothetical protein RL609_1071 [Bacteroidota bacterium]
MRKTILQSAFWLSVTSIFFFGVQSDNGKAGATGSPSEVNCTDCHSGTALNSAGGSITISCPELVNWEYTPGQTYTITCTVAEGVKTLFGFGFEALQTSGANGGTLTAGTGSSIKTANVGGNSRRNVVHQLNAGTGSGSHTWTFTWQAPATDQGNITFYCGAIAANGNGSDTGDHVYTKSQVLTCAVPNGVAQNQMNDWSVVNQRAAGQLVVNGSSETADVLTVKIFNLAGQEVFVQNGIAVAAGNFTQNVQVPTHISGMNVVVVMKGNEVMAKKKIWN